MTKKPLRQIRQGDVFLRRVDHKPTPRHKRVPLDNGRVILAYGELTGHAHAIDGQVAALFERGGERLLEVTDPTQLRHEEHDAIDLAPGVYEVIQQREYDPATAGERFVAD